VRVQFPNTFINEPIEWRAVYGSNDA